MTDIKTKNHVLKLSQEAKDLYDKGMYKEAVKVYKIALLMSKQTDLLYSLYIGLANSYYKLDDKDRYTYYYELYLKKYPLGQASIFQRLAKAYYYMDPDKSIDYHNKALGMDINTYDVSHKIFSMTKSSNYEQKDIKEEAEFEVDRLRDALFKNIKKYSHEDKKQLKDKKLNIGYLSSDCHAHTMMNYMLPIWENHNKQEFNFFIFNGSSKKDHTSERISKIGFEIVPCSNLSNEQLAKEIYDRKIDILIDLSGFTHLKSFALFYKPAPVIMSYLGYLNTMGMKEVDYIITDRFSIPEDMADLYTEKPLYLDKGYQIFMEKKIPELTDCPYKKNGYITFGSFNCTSKINEAVIYMWSQILKEVPDSKLLIYRTQMTKRIVKYLSDKFQQRGISLDRIMFRSTQFDPHFKAYSLADISLDTYPFSGLSIAIETALMGVPTVTLLGEGLQSKGAGRINQIINLSELNAQCGEDYIKAAVMLADNKEKLSFLKNSLKEKINNSDLVKNASEFTKDLEYKYHKAWEFFTNS